MNVSLRRPSVASLLLQPTVNGLPLGTATGFTVERPSGTYLITNRHVVRGRRQDTNQPMSATGGIPDSLVVVHNVANALGTWRAVSEPLYDNAGDPLWMEHPIGGAVDVVALRLTHLQGVAIYPHDPWASTTVALGPTEPLNIIGFPFGQTGGGALGIWVRGFIASELDVPYGDLPCFLIDSRTRAGQSGSPVIFYSGGGSYMSAAGGLVIGGGEVEEFVGVYSGRINDQSDLGLVWHAEVVRQIINQ